MLYDAISNLQKEYERIKAIRESVEKEIKKTPWLILMRALFWFYLPVIGGTALGCYLIYIYFFQQ